MRRLRNLTGAALVALAVALGTGADIPALAAGHVPDLPAAGIPRPRASINGGYWQFDDPALPTIAWLTPKLVRDIRLADAVHLAYRADAAWRDVADAAAARLLAIEWGVLPLPLAAGFYAADNRIVISYTVRDASPAALAALIAHEMSHAAAASCTFPFEAQTCIHDEVAAYTWAARVFSASGMAAASATLLDARWADVVGWWQRGELITMISSDPYYRRWYFTG